MEIVLKSDIDVTLINKMGADSALAMAAWVSTSSEDGMKRAVQKPEDVVGVINYLMKHRHGTPFEHSCLQFYIRAPIFVWREFHRHRIGVSYNEESARYKTLDPVFYVADVEKRPSKKVENWKPGRPKFIIDKDLNERVNQRNIEVYKIAYANYLANLADSCDPGFARDCLPVGIYSACWFTCNPRSLMHFLSLRTHEKDAAFVSYPLYEIELAARIIEKIFAEHWPITYQAFNKNNRVAP